MNLQFDPNVKVGDLIASFAIVVSILAVGANVWQDGQTKAREQANNIRSAATRAASKLDRVQSIEVSLSRNLSPAYRIASQKLAPQFDLASARSYVWYNIDSAIAQIADSVQSENIDAAYAGLTIFRPGIKARIQRAIAQLTTAQKNYVGGLKEATQVLILLTPKTGYAASSLETGLLQASFDEESKFREESAAILKPVHDELNRIAAMSDKEILEQDSAGLEIGAYRLISYSPIGTWLWLVGAVALGVAAILFVLPLMRRRGLVAAQ